MKDSVILGTGNSRYLKSVADFKTLYPTYDDFAAALVAGTLPIDLNGINPSGFQQVGDALAKATLLKDITAALYGMTEDAVPDDVFSYLHNAVRKEIIMQHENDGTVSDVYIDLTSIDFRKRIFVEVDAGENESNVGFNLYLEKSCNIVTANLNKMTASTATSTSNLNVSAFAYKGRPIRFELIVTGADSSGDPNYLQIDLRYEQQAKIFLVYGSNGVGSIRIHSSSAKFQAGSKITVYAI